MSDFDLIRNTIARNNQYLDDRRYDDCSRTFNLVIEFEERRGGEGAGDREPRIPLPDPGALAAELPPPTEREAGLLKALGFVRRQVAFAVSGQATSIALIGIIAGVPAGIAIGRLIWLSFASSFGVIPVPVVTAWAIMAVALGAVLIANVLTIGPAAAAARSRPASLLRAE